jgi:hypothetical protein
MDTKVLRFKTELSADINIKIKHLTIEVHECLRQAKNMDSLVTKCETKVKTVSLKLKDHVEEYPISEYAHDLLKTKKSDESSQGIGKDNPIDFIINITMEKLQGKLLSKIRKEMRAKNALKTIRQECHSNGNKRGLIIDKCRKENKISRPKRIF